MKTLMMIACSGALLLNAACSTAPKVNGEKPSELDLAPMELPVYTSPTKFLQKDMKDGSDRYYKYTKVRDDGAYEGENHKGCSWVESAQLVSPAVRWDNCGGSGNWHSGTVINFSRKGNIWPLKAGNEESQTFNFVDATGKVGARNVRKCKVEGLVNIEVTIGNVDAYKVVCKRTRDTWSQTRVWYFSPEHNAAVKYLKSSSSDGVEYDHELVGVESI